MRARDPDCDGIVVRDGIGIRYERYGQGWPAILLLPTWSIVPSRHWKMQVAYLARHFTVVCFDGRGSGGSGRPAEPAAYTDAQFASDAKAVMDAAGIETAVLVSASCGTLWALRLGAEHPDRVLGSVFIAPTAPLVPPLAERRVQRFGEVIDDPVGWQTYNAHYWKTHYPEFVTFFVRRIFTEPHSTKQVEDAIGWALETDGETLAAAHLGLECCDATATRRLAARIASPVLVIHGTDDAVRGYTEGESLARCTGGALVTLAGAGHFPHARGEREAFLTTDYNAEMIEHIDRYPWIRDRAIFVGNDDDIVPGTFGGDLPAIGGWTTRHFSFSGYITGFTPPEPGQMAALRAELGYRDDELVCVVAVGGSGVGQALLDKVVAAYPLAKKAMPELRMIVVTGPRIDPAAFAPRAGLEMHGYVHRLYQHLCACDLAIVQGGLTTTMELTAAKRPFLYFPLGHHFEQNFHVRHRLARYDAGTCMDYLATDPDQIAARIAELAGEPVSYRDVETDGAARAARLIAELV